MSNDDQLIGLGLWDLFFFERAIFSLQNLILNYKFSSQRNGEGGGTFINHPVNASSEEFFTRCFHRFFI